MSYYIKKTKPKVCPICGKKFSVETPRDYTYKRCNGRIYFCGWNCMRAYDRQKKSKKRQRLQHE